MDCAQWADTEGPSALFAAFGSGYTTIFSLRSILLQYPAAGGHHLHAQARGGEVQAGFIQMPLQRQVEGAGHFPLFDRCRLEARTENRTARLKTLHALNLQR